MARLTARIVPVSPDGEVLLLLDQDPGRPGVLRWGTIGGAVDPGETLPAAAVRELREETGIRVDEASLTDACYQLDYEFAWDGETYQAEATFFAVPLGRDVEVSFDDLEPDEIGNVLEARWWTPDDLEADGGAIVLDIPDILRAAVAAVHGSRP